LLFLFRKNKGKQTRIKHEADMATYHSKFSLYTKQKRAVLN